MICDPFYQFRTLDELEQWQVVWDMQPMLSRQDGENLFDLYQVDAFYVEARYMMPDNIKEGVRCFTTTTLIEPYLNQVDISKLTT